MIPVVAFDTSVLVAALLPRYSLHALGRPWLAAVDADKVRGSCSAHALAETYATLTALPHIRVPPSAASAAIARLKRRLLVVPVTDELAEAAIQRCAAIGVTSGAVYDAVHLVAGEASGAVAIVTLNPIDFERFRVATSPRLVVPPDDGGLL